MLSLISLVLAMDMDAAIAQLSGPSTWCAGAAALATTRDPRAVAALVDAYDIPMEESKVCLLDAVEQLGKDGAVDALLAGGDSLRALRAMGLVADERWLPALEAGMTAPSTRDAAFEALRVQRRSEPWEAACVRLLAHPEAKVRILASSLLAHRRSTREAVAARLAVETDAEVRGSLERALLPSE